jgi:hypothetical protein
VVSCFCVVKPNDNGIFPLKSLFYSYRSIHPIFTYDNVYSVHFLPYNDSTTITYLCLIRYVSVK